MTMPVTIVPTDAADAPLDGGEPLRRHALVIGGTGMLRGVSLELAKRYTTVSVLARTSRSLEDLREDAAPGRIHRIRCDWHDLARLRERLGESFDLHGMPRLVVCWCHATARDAPLTVARLVADETAPVRFVHVLGSASPQASSIRATWCQTLSTQPGIDYQIIQLGCQRSGLTFKWLDHGVICDGVLRAIETGERRTFIGDPIP